MAELDTNFVDAVLSANMNGKKRVRLTQIAENEYIVEDITEYEKVGSEYGQKEINTLNETVNGKVDKVEVIDDLDTVKAVTEDNVPVGCKAVTKFANDVKQSLTTENGTQFRFGQNSDGEYGYILNKDGADTVIPFKNNIKIVDLNFPVTGGFTSKTFNVNLSAYTHVLIKSNWGSTDYKSNPEESTLIPVDSKQRYCIAYRDGVCLHRPVTVYPDKIVFGNGHRGDNEHPTWCNPIAIYGVKDLIFIQ